jgi:hypothetical protein
LILHVGVLYQRARARLFSTELRDVMRLLCNVAAGLDGKLVAASVADEDVEDDYEGHRTRTTSASTSSSRFWILMFKKLLMIRKS